MTQELNVGVYIIPEGCTAKRVGNAIQVYQKKKTKLAPTEYRCKDCKHFVEGHTCFSRWSTKVCHMKPKEVTERMERKQERVARYKDYKLFYGAQPYGKPCEMFEARKEE